MVEVKVKDGFTSQECLVLGIILTQQRMTLKRTIPMLNKQRSTWKRVTLRICYHSSKKWLNFVTLMSSDKSRGKDHLWRECNYRLSMPPSDRLAIAYHHSLSLHLQIDFSNSDVLSLLRPSLPTSPLFSVTCTFSHFCAIWFEKVFKCNGCWVVSWLCSAGFLSQY